MRVSCCIAVLVACSTPPSSQPTPPPSPPSAPSPSPPSSPAPAPAPKQIDRDGDDDPEDPGTGHAPTAGDFERVGAPPLALARICDLTPFGDRLYMAHATSPLGSDGATITTYTPGAAKPFAVAFDWNRRGEPARGGAAGQGFVRVHAIEGRLFVPDADPPYNGLGIAERGTEGYVFVSAADGTFAPPRMPRHRPPATAGVLPRAYHVIDVIAYRGALFASTGSVPPTERAWRGPSPGALHRAGADLARWLYEVDYPFPYREGVWRLTFMVRFRDRLYAGIQDYDGREPNDFLIIEAPATGPITRAHVRPVKITPSGAAGTARWWVDARTNRLYWIAWTREGLQLRVTSDGDTWSVIALPASAGRPTDITRFRDAIVILTERGLWRLDGDAVAPIATVTEPKTPFAASDLFCVAPLAVFHDELYAGGQRGGALYRLRAR
jgi:hypothetical protein